jgi:hypothetical protein
VRRIATTVVALVGTEASSWVDRLGRHVNVLGITTDADDPPLDRAVASWRRVASGSNFTLIDIDPLHSVADAWIRLFAPDAFSPDSPRGEVEVARSETLRRFAAGAISMPDFYLVAGADELDETRLHWYLGLLHGHAPARVVPVPADETSLVGALGRLGAGRWWPDPAELLAGVESVVPDQVPWSRSTTAENSSITSGPTVM